MYDKRGSARNPTKYIYLYDSDDTPRGRIGFQADDQELWGRSEWPYPANSNNSGKSIAHFYMHENSFSPVIDLLRNEKPLFMVYREDVCFIGTSEKEPIGVGDESQP